MVFLDTVGLIAVWDRVDQWHSKANLAYQQLLKQGTVFCSTTYVLLECANTAARKTYRKDVFDLRDDLANEAALIFPSDEDWQNAWDEYRDGHPGSPGVVDLVSFRIMRQYGITDVFSNDKHFKAAGFNTLF
jgi:predicted nucleic acid-binding protein